MGGNVSVRQLVRLVWRRKELVLLPGIATALVGALVGLLVWAQVGVGGSVVLGVTGAAVVVPVATYLNAVTLLAADDALRGRPVGIGSCYRRAAGRLRAIAGWAPIGALGVVGALLMVGMVWSLTVYLVLPALVLDGVGIREARGRAREAYRRDHRRFMAGSGWMTVPLQVALLPSLVVFVLGLVATDRGLGALLMAAAALCLGVGVSLTASLYGVFRVVLYREPEGAGAAAEPVRAALHVSPVE